MNVIIFGATGGIGKFAVKHSLDRGYNVTAYVRNADKISFNSPHLTVVEGAINDQAAVRNALVGQDAVIWCVGIPIKKKYPHMESLEGHKILISEMNRLGIKRLIDWGTPSVPFSKDKKSFITVIPGVMASIALTMAKEEMIAIGTLIQNSDLDWTLVRFMAPQNTPYTGKTKVGFGDTKMKFSISREDIGAFMVEQIEDRTYIKSMPIIGS